MNQESNEPSSPAPADAAAALAAGPDGATLDGLADGLLCVDRDWRVRYLNPAAERLLRRSRQELVGQGLWDACPDLVGTGYYDACRGALQTDRPASHTGYYAPLATWFEARAFPHDDGLAVLFRDVSREREETAQLKYQATHDYLTGLPNRRQCMETLSCAIAEAAPGLTAQNASLAVLFLDLDRFKEVNDAFGHAEGDLLLCDVAERLRKFLTPAIFCARVGGDEFVLVLRGTNERAAEALANSILNAVSRPSDIHGRSVSLGACIGIAMLTAPGESAEMLLNYADAAMYAAKSAGRFQVRLYHRELMQGLGARLSLRGDIQGALTNSQFELHFQPQISMHDGSLCGAEALLRWRHPTRGLLGPAAFLEVILDSPLESALTEWVANATCQHISEWLADGLPVPRISFNLSARQLVAPDLAATIVRLARMHGVPPTLLDVEVTENSLMSDVEKASGILMELRQAGISASLDDFGSGYSSLAYLVRLPIDTLKIDQSFVWALGKMPTATAVIRGVVRLAHSLGMRTLAEGVETEVQRQMLIEEGCDAMQGFLFSRALPAAAFAALLRDTPP